MAIPASTVLAVVPRARRTGPDLCVETGSAETTKHEYDDEAGARAHSEYPWKNACNAHR